MLQESNPDAAYMHHKYERGRRVLRSMVALRLEIKANPSRISSSCFILLVLLVFFFAPGRIGFLRWILITARCRCSTTCWLSPTLVCLLALSHSDRHVRASLLCAWLIALCCAVLSYSGMIVSRRQHASSRSWVGFSVI